MASPADFDEANLLLKPAPGDEGRVGVLPARHDGRSVVSCWQLTEAEILEIVTTGKVWIGVNVGLRAPPPVFVTGHKQAALA